jgi:hypothetical protein
MATRLDEGLGWAATWTCDDAMERSSHALAHEGRVWLIDPVDDASGLAAAERLGTIAAVVQLLDRHPRDGEALAARYGVPYLRLPEALPDAPFEVFRTLWLPGWRELGLWWPQRRALVVAETVGTCAYFAPTQATVGVHPMLRLLPPGAPREHDAEVLLPGHGPALHAGAAAAVDEAYRHSRRDIPRAYLQAVRSFWPR